MIASNYILREIKLKDNEQIARIIREVLIEMGVPKTGSTYEDKTLNNLYEFYQRERATYYVIEHQNRVIGGGGIAHLDNFDGNICELQKMYFLPEARGKGLGTKMIEKCLTKAKEFSFDQCYLETMPYMAAAKALYQKNGFTQIDSPMGNTCHYSCDVWMIKKL